MTRKHFEIITEILKMRLEDLDDATHKYVVEQFATELSWTNDNFDRIRFLKASGVDV